MEDIKNLIIRRHFYEAIQYSGENALDILNFCKYCYIQNNIFLVYGNTIIDIDDWIIRLTDNYYIVLDNKSKEKLFQE